MKQPTVKYKVNSKWVENPCHSIRWGIDGCIESFTCFSGDLEYIFSRYEYPDRYFNPSGNVEAFLLFY
jgi:hypothetical protein